MRPLPAMHPWLKAAADTLSREANLPRDDLELSKQEIQTLLDVAGFAAHQSGARTNAPLLCYLIGRAAAGSGLTADEAATMVARAAARH
jgi:hypothetical protein